MRALVILFLFAMGPAYCSGQKLSDSDPLKDLVEGELVYEGSKGENTSGWTFTIQFDPKNVKINDEYSIYGNKTYIYDKNSQEILGLFNENNDKYFIYYTPQELINLALSSNYGDSVKKSTQEFKNILGYRCQKIILQLGEQATLELWITNKIKTGIILPGTPLSFEDIALEYELKISGRIDCKYIIKSISSIEIPAKEFDHVVPDEYKLIVPVSVFSLDSIWAKDYEENKFTSFQYPSFYDGREAVKKYLREGLAKLVKYKYRGVTSIDFTVTKDGLSKDIRIDFGKKSEYSEKIKEILLNMPKWMPARVKGKPVNSNVTILI